MTDDATSFSAAEARRPPEVTAPDRLRALRASGLLDSPPEAAFDRLTRLAARILDAPVSLVSLVSDDRQFFKSCVGLPPPYSESRQTPLSHSFCQYVTRGEPLVVEDARRHPLVRRNAAIRDLGVIAYAGYPVVDLDGRVLGSFCVIDSRPRAWSDDDLQLIADLAASVSTEIQLRQALARAEERARDAEDAAADLRRAEASLRHSLVARDEIAGIVSHDLRNPLNAVALAAELLHEADDPARRRDHLAKIDAAVGRMSRLISDLVDITRLESGTLSVHPEPVPAAELVTEACGEVADLAGRCGIRLDCRPPRATVTVQADRHRVLQVLSNLLSNALRHTPEGGCVEVGATATDDDQEVLFHVTDTGPGLPPDQARHVFDRFWRADRRRRDGAGLGLAIAKGIVDAHGGRIEVDTGPSEGATFRFTLPAAHDAPS